MNRLNAIKKENKKYNLIMCFAMTSLLIAFFVSFTCGRFSQVSVSEVFCILWDNIFGGIEKTWNNNAETVVMNLRLPRICASMLIGSALAMSGAAYQALFANPIASPDTLGVSNAASFGAVFGILLGLNALSVKITAFAIGICAILVVFSVAILLNKGRNLTVYLLLIGMIVSSIFSALLAILKYVADPDDQLPQITYWLMGSMSKITSDDVIAYIVFFLVGSIPLYLLRWRMNLLSLTEAEVKSLGENTFLLRGITVFCATLLTASATAMTGGISWVGLIIPHIVRYLVGTDFRKVLPLSGILGALFLLVMDNLSRTISANELPISIFTSLIGAPIFFIVLFVNRRSMSNDN